MQVSIYTFKNWVMLKHVFPYGIESDSTYTVWIDTVIHKPQIEKIRRVNAYLADIIEMNAQDCNALSVKFTLRRPERKHVRYGKLSN